MHIPKWLIAAAGVLFVVLIAAIAFFIGRETSLPPAAVIAASAAPQELSAVRAPAPEEPRLPPAAASGAIPSSITASVSGTASSNTTPSSATASGPAADNSQATAEARARVATYFKQMDAIQSAGTVGDQQEFATTIVNAAMGGDFSAVDDLVRTATDAERRAIALQPPSECAEYHRQAVTLLQESRAMISGLREGLKRNDTDALTAVGASAQSMKSRAESLERAGKALRARFGL
jgi:hypothetical protein